MLQGSKGSEVAEPGKILDIIHMLKEIEELPRTACFLLSNTQVESCIS